MKQNAWKNLELKIAAILLTVIILFSVTFYFAGRITVPVAVSISFIFTTGTYVFIKRIVKNTEATFTDVEKEKIIAEDMLRSFVNATPMSCHFWDRNMNIVDCNDAAIRLFKFDSKEAYIKNWTMKCNPEYQPNGQRSDVMGKALLEKAFAGGKCIFDWMHNLPDGTIMPTEVTFVRVKTGDDYFIIGYTRDLRKEKELEEKAGEIFQDELPGIYTKNYLEDKLARIIRILSRSSGELSLLMVSIDLFQEYSDTYGPMAANNCLKATADVLQKTARRADDFVARYRDNDFVIVLPNTDKIGAQMIADKLLSDINALNIPNKKSNVAPHITISAGITTGKVFHRQRITDYIKRAEEMLYISKQGGRNRTSYADL